MAVTREVASARPAAMAALAAAGAEIEQFDSPDIPELLRRLADRAVTLLLVEGGPALQQAFFDAGLVDRAQRVETPRELGEGIHVARGFTARGDSASRVIELGPDKLVEWDVHGTD